MSGEETDSSQRCCRTSTCKVLAAAGRGSAHAQSLWAGPTRTWERQGWSLGAARGTGWQARFPMSNSEIRPPPCPLCVPPGLGLFLRVGTCAACVEGRDWGPGSAGCRVPGPGQDRSQGKASLGYEHGVANSPFMQGILSHKQAPACPSQQHSNWPSGAALMEGGRGSLGSEDLVSLPIAAVLEYYLCGSRPVILLQCRAIESAAAIRWLCWWWATTCDEAGGSGSSPSPSLQAAWCGTQFSPSEVQSIVMGGWWDGSAGLVCWWAARGLVPRWSRAAHILGTACELSQKASPECRQATSSHGGLMANFGLRSCQRMANPAMTVCSS